MDDLSKSEKVIEYWIDKTSYDCMLSKYSDRKAIGDEAIKKRKALEDIKTVDEFYHRLEFSAELAQMRWDMAFIVEENKRLHEIIETVGWLHQRMDVVYGAYSHIKMLADKSRIDYAATESCLKQVLKLKKEFEDEIKQRSNKPDGTPS